MRTSTLIRGILGAALTVGLTAPAIPASAHVDAAPDGSGRARLTHEQRDIVEDATEHLRTPEAAIAAGYLPTQSCTELPGVGGMGYHYFNPALAASGVIDPSHPQVLVFVPDRRGGLTLGAAEYFKADDDQNVATTDDRPSLFGSHPFDGPMLGHEPGMPIHYDLHVWLYKHNPSGELSAWNPRVHCPAS